MFNIDDGWMVVSEVNPTERRWELGGHRDRPGSGSAFRRSDGTTGTLNELIPDGFELVDIGLHFFDRTTREETHVYLLADPKQVGFYLPGVEDAVRWQLTDGDLQIVIEEDEPPAGGRSRISELTWDEN